MRTRTLAVILLTLVCVRSEANGQATAAPAGGKSTLTPFLVRDAQGKMVPMPDPDPAKPVNYVKWVNETVGGGIKDNAADLYEAAYKLYPKTNIKREDLDKALEGPWDNLPSVAAWLKANQACLDKFKEATKKRQCFFYWRPDKPTKGKDGTPPKPVDPRMVDSLFHSSPCEFYAHKLIARALIAQGWQAWSQGDEKQLIDNVLAVLCSARHLDDQLASTQNIVGAICAYDGYCALATAMSVSRQPEAMAERLAPRLSTEDPPLDLRQLRGLAFNYASSRDACQRVFMPGVKRGSYTVSSECLQFMADLSADHKEIAPADVVRLDAIGYEATLHEFDVVAKLGQGWLGKRHSEFLKDREALGRAVVGSESPLVALVTPDLALAYKTEEARVANRRAVHLIAQLLVYHGKNKVYPDRLEDLKTTDLKELRVDPYSNKDFVYKKDGKSFKLYSVGENLTDDGGTEDDSWEKGDLVFWPVKP